MWWRVARSRGHGHGTTVERFQALLYCAVAFVCSDATLYTWPFPRFCPSKPTTTIGIATLDAPFVASQPQAAKALWAKKGYARL